MTPIQLTKDMITETIYFGDCLELMKEWVQQNGGLNNLGIPNRSGLVDQIYLDPPFNSKTNYNILFAKETNKDIGHTAQETVFTDTWTWGEHVEKRVENIIQTTTHPASNAILGIKETLGECGMLSYLSFIADRLRYMNYLLKETGEHLSPLRPHGKPLPQNDNGSHLRREKFQKRNRVEKNGSASPIH